MVIEGIVKKLFSYAARAYERYEPLRSYKGSIFDELDGGFTSNYFFANQFINEKCVLDAGCGCGYGVAILANRTEHIVGIDLSKKAIEFAKNYYNFSNGDFIIADCINLPFKEHSFDVVVSFEVIEHLTCHRKFLIETRKVLKWNGLFILSTPNKYVEFPHPFHIRELAPLELKSLLQQYFTDTKILGKKIVKEDRLIAEDQLRKSWRFRLGLLLHNSSLRVILLVFFFFPTKIRNVLWGLRVPNLNAYDFKFSDKEIEKAGTIIGIARKGYNLSAKAKAQGDVQ